MANEKRINTIKLQADLKRSCLFFCKSFGKISKKIDIYCRKTEVIIEQKSEKNIKITDFMEKMKE